MIREVKFLKKRIGWISLIVILFIILLFTGSIANFITDIEWFREVKYLSVYFTKIKAILILMIPIFSVFFIGLLLYYISIRKSIIRFNKVIEIKASRKKLEKNIFLIVDAIISLLLSYSFADSYWYRILQFSDSTSFNIKDPIFNMDVSFYIFKLPLIQSINDLFIGLLVFLVIITLVVYFTLNVKDKMTLDLKSIFSWGKANKSGLTGFAGKQLAIVSAIILLLISIDYILKAFELVYSPRGVVFGAGYTDANISLNFYRVISIVSFIAAVVVFVSIILSKVKPIVVSILSIVILIVLQGVTSEVVQNLIVKTNQISYEDKYIKNNINYTRKAFNLDNISQNNYSVNNNLSKDDLSNNKETIENIKINSYKPALDFYNQVQVLKYYYSFNDIDVDRYNINNKYSEVFIAPREINTDAIEPNTWQSRHLVYTHGYGIVMSKVNSVTSDGQPNFVIKDIPPQNDTNIDLKNSRIYFGEKTNDYAVVNTNREEVDYPSGESNAVNKYDGDTGIKMSFLNRLLFTVKEQNFNFMLSQDINSNSKILINRNILDRVNKIAPFLTYDKDPYMVISGGKLYWIIDAYTTSDKYPYSQPYNDVNYIRNSVKVIIDAFDGTTNFYIVDKNDPIANSYSKIFKGLFKDVDTIPQDLRAHFRYPEELFNLQCQVLAKYHMTEPSVFLTGEDLWEVAKNQNSDETDKGLNQASYVVMKLPQENKEEMILLQYFNMRDKENMVSILGARMDNENYGKLVLYRFPSQQAIDSPYLFKNKLNQDPNISKELSLWKSNGSQVYFGDTSILPINNSLLYVEPMYLIAQGKNSIPEMKRVIVKYGDKIVIDESIDKALEQIFNINVTNSTNPEASSSTPQTNINTDLAKQAKDLYDKAIEAQKNGDWAKYGDDISKLGDILNKLVK